MISLVGPPKAWSSSIGGTPGRLLMRLQLPGQPLFHGGPPGGGCGRSTSSRTTPLETLFSLFLSTPTLESTQIISDTGCWQPWRAGPGHSCGLERLCAWVNLGTRLNLAKGPAYLLPAGKLWPYRPSPHSDLGRVGKVWHHPLGTSAWLPASLLSLLPLFKPRTPILR